jgi:hypothetical protein
MAAKREPQYYIPQFYHDGFRFRKGGGDGSKYTVEAVEALLEPEWQPYYTDQRLEPVFSDKALIVMAIFESISTRTSASQILLWIEDNFKNPRFRTRGYLGDITNILHSDDDFISDSFLEDGDRNSPLLSWTHRPGLRRLLKSMRDTDGFRFSPDRHIKHHANKLKTRAALDLDLPISKLSSGEQQLLASEMQKHPPKSFSSAPKDVERPLEDSNEPHGGGPELAGSSGSAGFQGNTTVSGADLIAGCDSTGTPSHDKKLSPVGRDGLAGIQLDTIVAESSDSDCSEIWRDDGDFSERSASSLTPQTPMCDDQCKCNRHHSFLLENSDAGDTVGIEIREFRDSSLFAIFARSILRGSLGVVLRPLTEWLHQLVKSPVPLGMQRIRWRCRCGKLINDDYFELTHALCGLSDGKSSRLVPSSISEKIRARDHGSDEGQEGSGDLVAAGRISFSEQQGQGSNQTPNSPVSKSLRSIATSLKARLMVSPGAGSLPVHSPGNGVAKSTLTKIPRALDHLEFLLLCIPFKSHANKLLNIDTTTPPSSDKAFYGLLRQTYAKNRGRFRNLFSIRSLSEIRFVQFEVFQNDLADVRKFDCIPPEAQKDNYLYRPMPAEFVPPIGKNQMRHLYDHPDHADDLPVCYSRVPRKLRERLSAAPGIGRSDGWGICFIEGVSWPRVCALGLAGVLASTLFGVTWTVVQKDIQGGFGVASYMLGVLVLGLGALQGAFEM